LKIGEKGKVVYNENGELTGEIDAFLETQFESFREALRIEILYCDNGICETEFLNLHFKEYSLF
jgi:hypothetical protein